MKPFFLASFASSLRPALSRNAAAAAAAAGASSARCLSSSASSSAAAHELVVDGASRPLGALVETGALFDRCFPAGAAGLDLERWAAHGALLTKEILHKAPDAVLTQAEAVRIYQYYLPLYFWVEGLLDAKRNPSSGGGVGGGSGVGGGDTPLFVGLSCPQGGGKTTLVDALELLFKTDGKSCAEMSLDDFYLTHEEQKGVAKAHEGNGLLQLRGNFGTHDTGLVLATLDKLSASAEAYPMNGVLVPRYDKSAHKGKGDRHGDLSQWRNVTKKPDVVLFEGWCLGFQALPRDQVKDARLLPINDALEGEPSGGTGYPALHNRMEAWIVIQVSSPRCVYDWREQAEKAMRDAGKPAMTVQEVADFVDRYMPAYAHYLEGLYATGPAFSLAKPVLGFQIDAQRNPVPSNEALPFSP